MNPNSTQSYYKEKREENRLKDHQKDLPTKLMRTISHFIKTSQKT